MKTKIILSSLAFATLFIFSCNTEAKKETPGTEQSTPATAAAYTCPMHPEVKSDKPAQCPDCGMNLEKVETTDSASH